MNEEIERDNDLKEYCLDRFLDMCVGKLSEIEYAEADESYFA